MLIFNRRTFPLLQVKSEKILKIIHCKKQLIFWLEVSRSGVKSWVLVQPRRTFLIKVRIFEMLKFEFTDRCELDLSLIRFELSSIRLGLKMRLGLT